MAVQGPERPAGGGASPATAPRGEQACEGLCADCRWTRHVRSGRGSVFVLCRRAETDPGYARYPRLPRLACPGYQPRSRPAAAAQPPAPPVSS
jgi:hypothetical protein